MIQDLPTSARDTGDVGLTPRSEDPLEEDMATHSSIHAWRIPWTEEPGGLAESWKRLKWLSTRHAHPGLLSRVEHRNTFNHPNQSVTESSQVRLAFNQSNSNKFFLEITKQKLALIIFLTIHDYSKLTGIERGKEAISMGLVSQKYM